ncbi:PREDICTED: uncharacterized protein LOC105456153 [Wasmannia auropunctata]|uniref:uncharacterized protein LOC105456153 n=1 Tax=Wasmannia auropunctata TaxID=64793 RepID=UPI0005EEBD28|nr:PREDICTED: uncharacterized protein LOC105456153 [Wasmannia auropunctata]
MNNAVFGKTMENVRKHIDVAMTWEGRHGAEALIAKPNFHRRNVFTENLIAVELRKLKVQFYKPIYRHGPRVLILAQCIDDGEYVVVASVVARVRAHFDDIGLPQIVVTSNYDTFSRKVLSGRSMLGYE